VEVFVATVVPSMIVPEVVLVVVVTLELVPVNVPVPPWPSLLP
jgi:hypothetical protein